MVNIREQIVALLTPICENITFEYPDEFSELPLIVYGEISNITYDKWVDRVEFQVDVYDSTLKGCLEMVSDVDAAMILMGFTREYLSPDSTALVQRGVYHKAMSYTAKIDTHNNRVIYNFY